MFEKKEVKISDSPIKEVYRILDVGNVDELYNAYLAEDQNIVASKHADYHDPSLKTNQIKNILETVDARKLSAREKNERRLILWLWYHHAISYAVWGERNKGRAKRYSSLALRHQPQNHSNRITRMLYLLVRDRLRDAKILLASITDATEKKTARELIQFYEKGGFWG